MPLFDITLNKKQEAFYNEVMKACNGESTSRIFGYGGAIRGGKTSVCLYTIHQLASTHANLRVHVVRKSMQALKLTTIPSFKKIMSDCKDLIYNQDSTEVTYPNGSKIFFVAEDYVNDPDLSIFTSLETNIIFLEQAEDLQLDMYYKAVERVGSWYNAGDKATIPGMVFCTINPSKRWVKQIFYDAYKSGTLGDRQYYTFSAPSDNPYVSQDQWETWKYMDDASYRRFIEGDWDSLEDDDLK